MDEQIFSSLEIRRGRLKLLRVLVKSKCQAARADFAEKIGVRRATIL